MSDEYIETSSILIHTLDFPGLIVNGFDMTFSNLFLSHLKSHFCHDFYLHHSTFEGKEKHNFKNKKVKLVWSPETASKAYIGTVKSREVFQESSVAELISAMAAGWNAKLVVEMWSQGSDIATIVGLAVAMRHTGGRHICIVPDQKSKAEYLKAISQAGQESCEVIVGEPKEAMEGLEGIDFLVVDCKESNFERIIRLSRLGDRGAVLICKNASSKAAPGFRWRSVVDGRLRIVRSVYLSVGKGLDVAHVGASNGSSGRAKGERRWIKHLDRQSGEELVIGK